MIIKESLNFERGQDPKISMDIGNKWARIKVGDIIQCIRETDVEVKDSGEFITFKDPVSETYLENRDYYIEIGNLGYIKTIANLQEYFRITIIPGKTIEDFEGIGPFSNLFSTIKGTTTIDIWAKYFKVL
jgi:hypothetical protein